MRAWWGNNFDSILNVNCAENEVDEFENRQDDTNFVFADADI